MSDITRTKVLEILEHNWTSLHNPDYTDEELGKALDFCISSLETDEAYDLMYEQPEWCKDCISREQAIKEFCKQTCETPNCRFRDKGIAHASCDEVDVLKRLPSVLPKADVSETNVGKIGSTTKDNLGVDAISRQAVIDELKRYFHDEYYQRTSIQDCRDCFIEDVLNHLPSVISQLSSGLEKNSKKLENPITKNNLGVDAVSREAVQTRLKEIINEMETIFADIREREVNDSVCGLCEYDCDHGLDGFANECPGFEKDDCFKLNEKYRAEWLDISNMPSVTPQEPIKEHCKDCKWWKDSDGEYRRGCEAESICRINTDKVYRGEGYCYLFEPQESEDKKNG